MYSGFITTQRTVPAAGVHQRFDGAAYRIIAPYLASGSFPARRQILHFEGRNGPDGIKAKSPGHHDPGHLYNPVTGEGDIPELIQTHYDGLVTALQDSDMIRAAFEASFLAHYVCDGLTPAHHFPLDAQLAEHTARYKDKPRRFKYAMIVPGDTARESLRRSWALWGGKGLLTTHFNFEIGVATTLVGHRIRIRFEPTKLAAARLLGPIVFFQREAAEVAALNMYERFYDSGWTSELGWLVRARLAPQTVQAIGTIWLLAYLEAGCNEVIEAVHHPVEVPTRQTV
jgi:hypothetical protein